MSSICRKLLGFQKVNKYSVKKLENCFFYTYSTYQYNSGIGFYTDTYWPGYNTTQKYHRRNIYVFISQPKVSSNVDLLRLKSVEFYKSCDFRMAATMKSNHPYIE